MFLKTENIAFVFRGEKERVMKRDRNKPAIRALLPLAILSLLNVPNLGADATITLNGISHVLLISIDGLHQQDLVNYIQLRPSSALAGLSQMGVQYTNASTSKPSNSFPGLLSMV